MSDYVVLLAGRCEPTDALKEAVRDRPAIAADHGMVHAGPLGLVPQLWVGDFDSASDAEEAPPGDIERLSFPADKDRTDGEIALDAALERGARSVLIVGALGGPRTDHAFANMIVALRLARRGVAVELFDGVERGWILDERARSFEIPAGAQFSVLKFSDLSGLTLAGARWPLHDVDVPFHSILTQSNEAAGPVTASVRSGEAILLAQADPSVH